MAVKNILRSISSASEPSAGPSAIDKSAARLELLDDFERSAISWLWATDAAGRLTYLSESAAALLGMEIDQLLLQPFTKLFEIDPDNPDQMSDRPLNFVFQARNRIIDQVVRFAPARMVPGGKQTWLSISGAPKKAADGSFLGYRGGARDVSIEFARKLEDSRAAEFDSLTGLYNRHHMTRRLETVLTAYRQARRVCSVMMLDLDRFKQVNDLMGHQAGDDLLRQVGERLRKIIGDRGEIGRLGGDEFQIILPDLDDRGKLGELAEKIISIVSQPYPIDNKRAVIGTSVGIAVAPYDGIESDELVHASDLALYSAKNGGRGAFRFFSAELKDEREERRQLEEDLRQALSADELELHYQPVVRASDDLVIGLEGLMRWNHHERGAVPPNVFIPIAEETSLIVALGEFALRRACRDAAAWPASLRVAVNVSAVQFASPGFVTKVEEALAESGLEPARLELELTESVFMGDSEETETIFRELKKLGIRLALDDFGTGYSSLSYLRSAPFDKIKVDKSFVDSCTQKDQNSAKIIAAIIGLSDALGMETTVEGVEAFDQLDLVKSKGARLIQGYIYSKPLPRDEIERRIGSGEFRIKPQGPDRHRPERRSVFRQIGVIHEDHRYQAVMRDLSTTGARIDGLIGVPVGTGFVLDLGSGQLVVCKVTRVQDMIMAVEFETPLVSDGAGGLVTRHRVSPYALAAAGMPLASLPEGNYPLGLTDGGSTQPRFLQATVAR